MKKISLLMSVFGILLATGCVPPTKFKTLEQQHGDCQQERQKLKTENDKVIAENRELRSSLINTQKDLTETASDKKACNEELAALQQQNHQLNQDYDDLKKAQQALLKGSEEEIRKLMTELQASRENLDQQEQELSNLSGALDDKKKSIDQMEAELNQRNARLAELETILKEQEATVKLLKKSVSDALTGFENQGLTISQKNGKVYVSLEEKLLFPSGSTIVDPRGVTALKKLAGVLEQNTDISILIEGHTDDVPVISGSSFKDNWDLSVLRATSIVRILLQGSSIDPKRLTVSGRGEFFPVDPAKTAEARQKNRRTEIILSPDLEKLYKLIE
ncbi:MAG: OmpA family protein [Bacteroidales bacterium]|nr:OmpA family protein [Bacteroidales bacterium]MBN2763275.1 OmpA family protein [Bacteroidales bacterium]